MQAQTLGKVPDPAFGHWSLTTHHLELTAATFLLCPIWDWGLCNVQVWTKSTKLSDPLTPTPSPQDSILSPGSLRSAP